MKKSYLILQNNSFEAFDHIPLDISFDLVLVHHNKLRLEISLANQTPLPEVKPIQIIIVTLTKINQQEKTIN